MIPKVIHYCWFGGKPLPKIARKCIQSWKRFCPDYEIVEWNEKNYDIHKNSYMEEAYLQKKWGFVPDFARLDIIYQNGGIYLDTDVELIRPLDELLYHRAYMGFEGERDGVAINPGLGFGAEKNNPILLEMMKDIYGNRHFCREDKSIDMTPSPRLMTDFLVKKGLLVRNQRQCIGNELEIYPKSFFAPKDFWDGGLFIKADTFSIHHYDASWVDWENRVVKWLRWFLPRFGVFGKGLLFALTKMFGLIRHIRLYIARKIKRQKGKNNGR